MSECAEYAWHAAAHGSAAGEGTYQTSEQLLLSKNQF